MRSLNDLKSVGLYFPPAPPKIQTLTMTFDDQNGVMNAWSQIHTHMEGLSQPMLSDWTKPRSMYMDFDFGTVVLRQVMIVAVDATYPDGRPGGSEEFEIRVQFHRKPNDYYRAAAAPAVEKDRNLLDLI